MKRPDFAKCGGLVPAIAQEACSGEVLSRGKIWHKGGTSGHVQKVQSIRLDCDADTILVLVEQIGGAACHEGYKSCFFTEITNDGERTCAAKVFDPKEVYK